MPTSSEMSPPPGKLEQADTREPLASELCQDSGLARESAAPHPHALHDAQRHTQEEAPRGLLLLFTKTLLSDMLDKKNYSHNQVMPK